MSHLSAVHHLATATNDLARMTSFYKEAFDLDPKPGFPMETPVGTIAFFDIGGVELQIAESGTIEPAPADMPAVLLQKDLRLDHVTFQIDDVDTFATVRENLMRLGASDGNVVDFQGQGLLAFRDPDGHIMEVICPAGVTST